MKNITLQKDGDGITVHTPHGQVGDDLMVYPEGVSNIHVVRMRDRGAIQMKEIGDANDPTPLGKIALDFLKTNCKKATDNNLL